ncbi:MAG: DUF1653 domain-containing protein [Agarilytica sp.]
MSTAESITPGTYKHYKGNEYEVYGVVTHSETVEPMVLYRALYGERGLWVRPLGMFKEAITIDGEELVRFTLIAKAQTDGPQAPLFESEF